MNGLVLVVAVSCAVMAVVALVDWRRERREYEARVEMWADMLAQLREPTPADVAREWRSFVAGLPEVKR